MADAIIVLGGGRFSLSVPDDAEKNLRLLGAGAQTADEAYVLSRLLGLLKGAHNVRLLAEEDEESGEDARPLFFERLREREMLLAHQLRNLLGEVGAQWK